MFLAEENDFKLDEPLLSPSLSDFLFLLPISTSNLFIELVKETTLIKKLLSLKSTNNGK